MHRTAASVPLAVPSGRWPSAAGDAARYAAEGGAFLDITYEI